MLKLFKSDSSYDISEPTLRLINLDVEQELEKSAEHEEISSFIKTLVKKPNHSYLHILAMTAGEWYSSNRNGDYFPEENLKRYYKTFETEPAYFYRHHVNKDKAKSYGKVIFACYNDNMHRVELIVEAPNELIEDINSRIALGDWPLTSMALRTPYDTCSLCGNKARSRQEYCVHLKTQLNKLLPDGRKVMAINDGPLTAFDISAVIRPADPNSSILQKIAYDGSTMGSAELAEVEGLTEDGFHKRASMKKLSELIKEITDGCYVVDVLAPAGKGLGSASPKDLPIHLVEKLHHFDLSQVLASMADMGISPSVKFLAELIARKKLGEGYDGIGEIVQNFMADVPTSEQVPVLHFEEPSERSLMVDSILKPFVDSCSLTADAIEKRASNIGYAGNGPHIEPTEAELAQQKALSVELAKQEMQSVGYTKLLLGLGAAALLAKYFITSQIEKKFREQKSAHENGVKITIVKQSSDYRVASHLSKVAMAQALPKIKQEEKQSDGSKALGVGLSATKKALESSQTKIGGKLAGLLRLISLGSKVSNLGA